MSREIMQGDAQPFVSLQQDRGKGGLLEYINIGCSDGDVTPVDNSTEELTRLGLNEYSTAEQVRDKAIELRSKFQSLLKNGGKGGLEYFVHDLFFVLSRTGDIKNTEDLSNFLLLGWSLKEVALYREIKSGSG